nr:hypothetical protein [Tanacetum cinerariifolium]
QAPTVTTTENINQAETSKENAQIKEDKFINIFSTPKNKRDEENNVTGNKSHLIAKGYKQKEEINFEESFALVVRLKAVRLFVAYATIQVISYLSDGRKDSFFNGPLKEEVYVNQPDGFVDPYYPNKVYRLKKALYGLKQAPRAWYDELSDFLVSKGLSKGFIDPNLFITKKGKTYCLCKFTLMTLFLAKYAQEILKRHGMTLCDIIGTPLATKPLDADLSRTLIDQTIYRSMVGALMYLTSSIPDIVDAICYCARYQARPNKKHLKEVKRIF